MRKNIKYQDMVHVCAKLEGLFFTEKDVEKFQTKITKLEQDLVIANDRLRESIKRERLLNHSCQKAILAAETAKTEKKHFKMRFDKAKEKVVELSTTVRQLEQTACDATLRAVKAEGRLLERAANKT